MVLCKVPLTFIYSNMRFTIFVLLASIIGLGAAQAPPTPVDPTKPGSSPVHPNNPFQTHDHVDRCQRKCTGGTLNILQKRWRKSPEWCERHCQAEKPPVVARSQLEIARPGPFSLHLGLHKGHPEECKSCAKAAGIAANGTHDPSGRDYWCKEHCEHYPGYPWATLTTFYIAQARHDSVKWLEHCQYQAPAPNATLIEENIKAITKDLYNTAAEQGKLEWLSGTMTTCEAVSNPFPRFPGFSKGIQSKLAVPPISPQERWEKIMNALKMRLGCLTVANATLAGKKLPDWCTDLGSGWTEIPGPDGY